MEDIFLKLLNLSVKAGWLVLAVLAVRLILSRTRAPKSVMVLLWGLVGLRLLCPFSIESVVSLIPSKELISPETVRYDAAPTIHTGLPAIDSAVNPGFSQTFAPEAGASVNPLYVLTVAASWVWAAGCAAMVIYFIFSAVSLRHMVRGAEMAEKGVWQSDRIPSPFVFGFLRPRIYLPSGLEPENREFVLAHERSHIRRGDHLIKPLAFLVLCVYWFNPLMWLAYIFLCRDIELSCDERVLGELGPGAKRAYSTALLSAVTFHRHVAACPVAFGEGKLKARVKNVLRWKKPVLWLTVLSLVIVAVVAVCLLTDPEDAKADEDASRLAGTYVLTSGGDVGTIGGDFTISLSEDGTMSYTEGFFSSHLGYGRWEAEIGPYGVLGENALEAGSGEDTIVTLYEDNGWTFRFRVVDGALVFIAEGSDSFTYADLLDGALFERDRGEPGGSSVENPAEHPGEDPAAPATLLGSYDYYFSPSDPYPVRFTLYSGGRYEYSVGGPSAYSGGGTWTQRGDYIELEDKSFEPAISYRFDLADGGIAYAAAYSDPLPGIELPDGALFAKSSGESLPSWASRSPSGRYVISQSSDEEETDARIVDTTTLQTVWSGTMTRRSETWNEYNESLLALRREGGVYVLDLESGAEYTVDLPKAEEGREIVLDYWYGGDWLFLLSYGREDTDHHYLIYTLGDASAKSQGTREFYDELFGKANSPGALSEPLGRAFDRIFRASAGDFLENLSRRPENTASAVRRLLVLDNFDVSVNPDRALNSLRQDLDALRRAGGAPEAELDALEAVMEDVIAEAKNRGATYPTFRGVSTPQEPFEPDIQIPSGSVALRPIPENVGLRPHDTVLELPPVEGGDFEGFDALTLPSLPAWRITVTEPSAVSEKLRARAESAAKNLWGSFTAEDMYSGSTWYYSPSVETENGEYYERLILEPGGISFLARWAEVETTPFYYDTPVDAATAVDRARSVASALGLDGVTREAPRVTTSRGGQEHGIYWTVKVGGMDAVNLVTANVICGHVESLTLNVCALTFSVEPPEYFLSPENALFAINEARAIASYGGGGSDNGLKNAPNPLRVYLGWSNAFTESRDTYSPAYIFQFESDELVSEGVPYRLTETAAVDPATGDVRLLTRDEFWPSPYILDPAR